MDLTRQSALLEKLGKLADAFGSFAVCNYPGWELMRCGAFSNRQAVVKPTLIEAISDALELDPKTIENGTFFEAVSGKLSAQAGRGNTLFIAQLNGKFKAKLGRATWLHFCAPQGKSIVEVIENQKI